MWFNSFFPFYSIPAANSKKLARYENDMEFQNTFFHFFNLAVNTFEWVDLPPSCNERFLEMCLLLDGVAAFCLDDTLGLVTLKASPVAEQYNIYGDTNKIYGYGWNGFMKEYTAYMEGSDNTKAKAVLVRDNPVCYPYVTHILLYANRLTTTMRSMDVAAKKLKVPYFVACDESQKASVEKILNDVDENKERIIANRSTGDNLFNVFPTRIDPQLLKTFWEHYNNLDGRLKDVLGVNNPVNSDKRERLLVDEVNANNKAVGISIDIRLRERQRIAEIVNKLYKTNISVRVREGYGNSNVDEMEVDKSVDGIQAF